MYGKDSAFENSPTQIDFALSKGYDVEIDLRLHDNRFYLGHDFAQYEVEESYLHNDRFWIHAKNFEALEWLSTTKLNYFWHQEDEYTLTSHGYIWTYPEGELGKNSVCVMPELYMDIRNCLLLNCYAICTDHVELLDFRSKA